MIAFTICSNNYLAKAKILLDSIKSRENVIVLLFVADQKQETIDYELLGFDKIIFPTELDIKNLQWQLETYNIIEFNTALKAAAFKFVLAKTYLKAAAFKYVFAKTNSETIYYFDPDIKVYKELSAFERYWKNSSMVLTPHILSPLPLDDFFPGENLFLNHGIYNLGFLGLRKGTVTTDFLEWWEDRLSKKCIIDLKDGYFTDQLWFNLVPHFFKDVEILEHHGFNAAYWNLHEREISFNNGFPIVNFNQDLFFYHFSGFDKNLKTLIPSERPRYNFDSRANLLPLYDDYLKDLNKNIVLQEANPPYYNGLYPIKKKRPTYLERIIKRLNR